MKKNKPEFFQNRIIVRFVSNQRLFFRLKSRVRSKFPKELEGQLQKESNLLKNKSL